MSPFGDYTSILALRLGVKVVSVADGCRFSGASNVGLELNIKTRGPSMLCLTEIGLKIALLEWCSTYIFAL